MSEEILTVKDVAALVGVSPQTVHRWVKEGNGPKGFALPSKSKRTYRFKREDVEAWFDDLSVCDNGYEEEEEAA